MKKSSFYRRLLVMTLVPACCMALILASYFSFAGLRSMEEEMLQRGKDIVRYMAPTSEYGMVSGNWQSLQGMVQAAVQQQDVLAAAVVSVDGRVVAVSGRLHLAPEKLKNLTAEADQLASDKGWIAFAAPIRRTPAQADVVLDYTGDMPAETGPLGQVVVELDTAHLITRQRELIGKGAAILFPTLLLAVWFVSRQAKKLVRPVERLVEAVRGMTEGRLDTRVQAVSAGEIGELERGFNTMAGHIANEQQTLQRRIDEATAQLAYQARHDALTGLINRREFETRLELAIRAARLGGENSSVLFLDLDRFKRVNDQCGHMAGDELLRRLSRQLENRLRERDTLGRLGGDEFGVLLPGCEGENACHLAESLCQLVAAFRFPWEDKVFSVGASIGLVRVDADSSSVAAVLGAGDAACYAAKAAGRNRVEIYAPSQTEMRQHDHDPRRERLESVLREQRLNCAVEVLCPAASEQTPGQVFELSALLNEGPANSLPVALVMEAAERYELAQAFDQYLLAQALQAVARETGGLPLKCLIRISAASMRYPEHRQALVQLAGAVPEQAARVVLMLPEEAATQYPAEMKHFVRAVREVGCGVGLDDFGGWMGSFSHLAELSPDFVRVTPTLVRDVASNRNSSTLIRAIQDIARDHAVLTIAAQVDDLAMRQALQAVGVDYLQGRQVTAPVALDDWQSLTGQAGD